MLTAEENDLLTKTGPGTPGGDFLRRYWQPVALAREVASGAPPLPLRILSEDLVLFRDDAGRLGLLAVHCSHRAADLSYGRIEDGGLRCLYHGWLYDVHGNCLEQPGEPERSPVGRRDSQSGSSEVVIRTFKDKIKHPAYPCQERAGLVFAYMGPGKPPLLPAYEALECPDDHRWVAKAFHDCNYLQANEGNYDSHHVEFLHGFLKTRTGKALSLDHPRDTTQFTPEHRLLRVPVAYETEDTDYGVRIWSFRSAGEDGRRGVSIGNFVLPNLSAVQGGPQPQGDGYLINWHVPAGDYSHWRFSIAFKRSGPLDPKLGERRTSVLGPDFRFLANPSNRYLQNREEMKETTFSGFGSVFVVGDHWATETAGAIQDRTREHLGSADKGIAAARRVTLRAIRQMLEGQDPPHVIRRPEEKDMSHLRVEDETVDASVPFAEHVRRRAIPRGVLARQG